MPTANSRSANRDLWMVVGLTLIGLLLRVILLNGKSFWQDEGVTYYFTRGPIFEDGSPGLYFKILYLFQTLFGRGEIAGRSLSVLCGTLTIPLFFLLAKALFGRHAALLSALIFALSPFAIAVSQEMRMYSLTGLELVLVMYCTWRILEITSLMNVGVGGDPDYRMGGSTSSLKWYLGVFLAGLAGVYTHIVFIFMLAFLTVAFFFLSRSASLKSFYYWCLTMAVMGMAYIPELFRWTERAGSRQHIIVEANGRAIKASIMVMVRSLNQFLIGFYYKIFKSDVLHFPKVLLLMLLLALVIGLFWAAFVVWKRRSALPPHCRRAAGFMTAFLLFNFCLFLVLEVSSSRHMVSFYFVFVLLLGFLLSQLTIKWRSVLLGMLGLFTLLSLIYYYRAPYFPYEEADWRSLGRYLESHVAPEDVVFCEAGRNAFYTVLYYAPELPCQMRYLNTKDWPADPYQVKFQRQYLTQPTLLYQNLANQYARVWLVTMAGHITTFSGQNQIPALDTRRFGPELSLIAFE